MRARITTTLGSVLIAGAALATGAPAAHAGLTAPAARPGKAAAAASAPGFGHESVVDSQRITGEPSLSVSPATNAAGNHDIYVSAPFGFLTTASFVWKSEDGGQTFHLVAGQEPPLGKPNTCAGGGDSAIATDTAGNLYFADLQGLTDVSNSVSTDGGRSFTTTCNSANSTATDRPWVATYGNPLTTGREYMAVDDVGQCTVNCGLGQAGSNMLALTSAGGLAAQQQLFTPLPAQQIEPDGIVSGMVTDQRNGDLYIAHTALTDASGKLTGGGDPNGYDNAIVVDRFPHGFSASAATPVPPSSISLCAPYNPGGPCQSDTAYHAPLTSVSGSTYSTVAVGQDFSPIAIDSAGDLYVVWAQAPIDPSTGNITGPSAIYLAVSTDQGKTWGAPVNVSANVPGLPTNVFPTVAAGSQGKVDIAWYGTDVLGNCSTGCGSSNVNGSWNVYMAQTLNAVTSSGAPNASPSFTTTKVSEFPNHFGAICTFGISCTTGGDRGLLDFIQVKVDPSGAANVVWADSANTNMLGGTSSAAIVFARQVSGQGLYGSKVSGPAPASGSAAGSPDAYFAGGGVENQATQNLKIESSSISGPDQAGNYTVTMKVANLSSLSVPGTLGGPDAVWLTRWELPTSSPAPQDQGHVFYAAMESDGGGTPTFYAGETQTAEVAQESSTQQGFFFTYPPQYQVAGSYTPGSPGTITITVPAKDVGNPGARNLDLYSATGLTVTQGEPSSSGTQMFNLIDATSPYDVSYKK